MTTGGWMIYGATGYTGSLIAEQAATDGKRPVIAGRKTDKVMALADRLGLAHQVFSLDDPDAVAQALTEVDLVLHCAGPYSATSRPMLEACLATGTHYLDITGEISVFEDVLGRGAEAERAGVVLLPGVGFDVVPTDCLAGLLKQELPDAVELELAFASGGGASKGTMETAVEMASIGGYVRRDGELVSVPIAHQSQRVTFSDRARDVFSVPWGDVSTAYFSTGIPNITCFMAMPPRLGRAAKLVGRLGGVLGLAPVQRSLKWLVEQTVTGPTEHARKRRRTRVWGRVRTREGATVTGTLECPQAYRITVDAALACVEGVLAGQAGPGAHTPATALGPDLVRMLPEVELVVPAS